jgi:hypothetical protein
MGLLEMRRVVGGRQDSRRSRPAVAPLPLAARGVPAAHDESLLSAGRELKLGLVLHRGCRGRGDREKEKVGGEVLGSDCPKSSLR